MHKIKKVFLFYWGRGSRWLASFNEGSREMTFLDICFLLDQIYIPLLLKRARDHCLRSLDCHSWIYSAHSSKQLVNGRTNSRVTKALLAICCHSITNIRPGSSTCQGKTVSYNEQGYPWSQAIFWCVP